MKHNFSIRDIVGALKTVRGVKNYYSDAQLAHLVDEAREVNAILDALPEPPLKLATPALSIAFAKLNGVTGDDEETKAKYINQAAQLAAVQMPDDLLNVFTRIAGSMQLNLDDVLMMRDRGVEISQETLNALLETVADEWEKCEFSDIRKGDRVKRVQHRKFEDSEMTSIKTAEAWGNRYEKHDPIMRDGNIWWDVSGSPIAYEKDDQECENVTLYRIPAPVEHPDPAKDFLIVDHDDDGSEYVASNGAYVSIYQLHLRISPEEITNWSPAKVVPAGDV